MSSKTAAASSSARCTAHSALTRSLRTTAAARPTRIGIIQHQQLGIEDRRQIGASRRRDPPANLLELLRERWRARSSAESSRATPSGPTGKRSTCVR